jgi:hypothetical protein
MDGSQRRRRHGDRGPSERLVMAALRRAVLHGRPRPAAAPLHAVLDHLAIPRRSRAAREVAATLAGLEREGLVRRERVHGVAVWAPTAAGRRRLAGRAGPMPYEELPESPQHRAWRRARLAASEELPRFAAELAAGLDEAAAMLDALADHDRAPHSDAWLALGPRLLGQCRRLGSAWHCLHEWPEPADSRPDRDEPPPGARRELRALRAGRRNVALWRERGGSIEPGSERGG